MKTQQINKTLNDNKYFFDAVIMRASEMVKNGEDLNKDLISKAMKKEIAFEEEMAFSGNERAVLAQKAIIKSVYYQLNQ